jgi:alkanesulfonate monooxygenase SsuD/methylene tetrahydromethanopterin reductase-like flavin-dependent oxidoreductase (luciferase family)
MLIGFNAPVAGSLAKLEVLTRIAAEGEAMGFDYLAFSDHIVIPTDIQARYPYSDTGEFRQGARGGRHEQLTEIAILAAKTSRSACDVDDGGTAPTGGADRDN